MNGAAMARHGLILRETEATGSRKVFKCLPGFRDTILTPKFTQKNPNPLKRKNQHVCYIRRPLWGHQACDIYCPLLLSSPWGAAAVNLDLPPEEKLLVRVELNVPLGTKILIFGE